MAAIRIIAKMPTLAAIAYKQSIGELADVTAVVTSVLVHTWRPLPTTVTAHMFIVPRFLGRRAAHNVPEESLVVCGEPDAGEPAPHCLAHQSGRLLKSGVSPPPALASGPAVRQHPPLRIQMMFSLPTEPYELNPVKVRALELFLILHVRPPSNDRSYACAEWRNSFLRLPFATICCTIAVSCAAVAIQAAAAAAVHELCWRLLGRHASPRAAEDSADSSVGPTAHRSTTSRMPAPAL